MYRDIVIRYANETASALVCLGIFSLHQYVQTGSGDHTDSYPVSTGSSFTPEIKRPGREADHSPPSGSEVKDAWSYTSTPQYAFIEWCLIKQGMYLHCAELY
jgi:hypothetical protein